MTRGPTVYRDVPRVDARLLASLDGLAVSDLHDALPPATRAVALLGPQIRPLTPGLRVHGQAVTVLCAPGDSLMSHLGLYLARPGDVLVISNGGVPHGALWGGNVAFDAKARGIAGAVVDAPARDVGFIRSLKHPAWASSVSASRAEKRGEGTVNLPVACGGRTVNPGDIVVADDDGVLVFAPEQIEPIVAKVQARLRAEIEMRQRIEAGEPLFETQRFGELLEEAGIRIEDGHWLGD